MQFHDKRNPSQYDTHFDFAIKYYDLWKSNGEVGCSTKPTLIWQFKLLNLNPDLLIPTNKESEF